MSDFKLNFPENNSIQNMALVTHTHCYFHRQPITDHVHTSAIILSAIKALSQHSLTEKYCVIFASVYAACFPGFIPALVF